MEPSLEQRKQALADLQDASPAGKARRTKLHAALVDMDYEEHGLGIEMNQRYISSAVYHADQGPPPPFEKDPLKHYHPTTYPGARVPHAWFNKAVPTRLVSTIDLAGKGAFTLFTGIGGQPWKDAALALSAELGVPMKAYVIGFRQDYEDTYYTWQRLRGVEESGCVLVRPDTFVAWRCPEVEDNCVSRLRKVMRSVLSLE
jgi:hypothetical protein